MPRNSRETETVGTYAQPEMSTRTTLGTRERDRAQALRAILGGRSVVYALRLADGIFKIGCSRDVRRRRNHYRGSEIVAFRFGDRDDEQAVHRRLRASVARGREYYRPTPEVLAVINDMRRDFGLLPLDE